MTSRPAIQSPWAPYIRGLKYLLLFIFVLLFLMPVYAVVATALKTSAEVSVPGMWEFPWPLSLDSFTTVLDKPEIQRGLINSLLLAVPASILSAILGAANGFVLSKWRFKGADLVFSILLFGMFIPYQAVLIPMTQFMTQIGLRGGSEPTGGLLGLILVHVVYGIPITTLIFRSYYAGIPDTVFDSAQVDGAGMLRAFWHIALPLAPPAFAVTVIWQFTAVWNDFIFGVVMTSTTAWPITIGLNNIAAVQTIPFDQVMASALIASLPTLLVYILLGRYFMRGLLAGSLKGLRACPGTYLAALQASLPTKPVGGGSLRLAMHAPGRAHPARPGTCLAAPLAGLPTKPVGGAWRRVHRVGWARTPGVANLETRHGPANLNGRAGPESLQY